MKALASLVACLALSATSAQATCLKPAIAGIFGTAPVPESNEFKFRRFWLSGRQYQWVAASFGAPSDGFVFVADCRGREVADRDNKLGGFVKAMKIGPRINGKPTLIISYVPGTGPNFRVLSAAVLQFDGVSINTLWDHSTFEGSYFPATFGPQEETTYTWAFGSHSSRIIARGRKSVGYKRFRTTTLPKQDFCLRRSVKKYLPCE